MSTFDAAIMRNISAPPPISVQRAAGVSGLAGVPSSFMNIAHSVGMMTSATKSELDSVTMSVLGM